MLKNIVIEEIHKFLTENKSKYGKAKESLMKSK